MLTLLVVVHIVVCVFLILVVLLQSGRGADLAGAFGVSGSQTAFGPRGAATFLSRATEFLAVVFMVTSLALATFSVGARPRSLAEEGGKPTTPQSTPAVPANPQQTPPAEPPPPPQK